MFTGLVQGMGEVRRLVRGASECRLEIAPLFPLENIIDGESIAVNGACLSVEEHHDSIFTAYASAETLARTTLGSLQTGSHVNLERALQLGSRLGGHIVSGHVDCIATVTQLARAGQSLRCTLTFPREFAPEVIPKGSVTLDGISLTINECGMDSLAVNVIPDTQRRTVMAQWRPGSRVNMETDVLGKYVRRQFQCREQEKSGPGRAASGVSYDLLLQNGFL